MPSLSYEGIAFLWGTDAEPSDNLTSDELDRQQTLGSESVLALVQALISSDMERKPALWLITAGAQAVEPGEVVSVAQSPLWGLGRTLALEQSNLWGGLVDLDPHMNAQMAAEQLLQSFESSNQEDQIALRLGNRYAPRLVRHRPVIQHDFEVAADAAYLITGGLGGLGLEVSQWLVDKGARHLILMARTPLPARDAWDTVDPESLVGQRIAAVRQMESLGAAVIIVAIDVSDTDSMRDFLTRYQAQGLPPVRGIVHTAGIMQYQGIQDHNLDDMRAIYAPKVMGSWLLHSLFADAPLDFFVTFSSTSALLSSPLMCSYAAANNFMDALAHYRQSQGLPALSINWGTWREAGMATAADAPTRSLDVSQSLSNAEGLAALNRLLCGNASQVAVMPVDWGRYTAFGRVPFLDNLTTPTRVERPHNETKTSIRQTILALSPEERESALCEHLHHQIAGILGFSTEKLDVSMSLAAVGIDSLMAVEIKNYVEKHLGVTMSIVQLLQGPSIQELSTTILRQLADSPQQHSAQDEQTLAHEAVAETDWEEGEL